ncbi:MAG TPA: heparan-alpha-glucosaminide N-acetyltransferase domain-containing protein [Verrucomicrobiae bacterium]|nr:heparan-alpha-glucosaminide N-acetyltransferase domain-containing protein [Verrucomicrobiae bacterium]
MKRFPFLDWMRGLACIVMIQCHTFNSFVRLDLRPTAGYGLSQFIGGMAAPLFLFMAGMTSAFQMESLARREPSPLRRWLISLRRAGYILAIAFLFRLTNFLGSLPHANPAEITRVDILNCMAVAMAVFSVAAIFDSDRRARFAMLTALAIAAITPVMAHLPWDGAPRLMREYLVPFAGRGQFPLFPTASYLGFGLAAGVVVKRTAEQRFDRMMQWSLLIGLLVTLAAQYFSNLPASVYGDVSFWTESPALILIRGGLMLSVMAVCYLWTQYIAGPGWSWMQCMGKNSLMVYWVHVVMVYGGVAQPFKRTMSLPLVVLLTATLVALMVGMSALWIRWKARKEPAAKQPPEVHSINEIELAG